MNKLKFALLSITGLVMPLAALAQDRSAAIANDSIAYASVFSGDFSILLSIVIGIIATFYVFRSAGKMGGGLFGSVLNYIGVGMVLIVLGTISVVLGTWLLLGIWGSALNTVFFALGYIFMVIGANKLLKGIIST